MNTAKVITWIIVVMFLFNVAQCALLGSMQLEIFKLQDEIDRETIIYSGE